MPSFIFEGSLKYNHRAYYDRPFLNLKIVIDVVSWFRNCLRFQKTPLELFSTRRSDDTKVRITIKRVGTLEEGDYQKVQIMNIIVRKCLGALKLEEIRRNYYDPKAKVSICKVGAFIS